MVEAGGGGRPGRQSFAAQVAETLLEAGDVAPVVGRATERGS